MVVPKLNSRYLIFISTILSKVLSLNTQSTRSKSAIAVLSSVGSSNSTGMITFEETTDNKLIIKLTAQNLQPDSFHAIHIHAFGDMSDSKEALLMGGHFNPTKKNHSCPLGMATLNPEAHVGDLGSFTSDLNGNVNISMVTEMISGIAGLDSALNTFILGHGVIIHAKQDNCNAQVCSIKNINIYVCINIMNS